MTRTISLVQQVRIASPCSVKWEDMVGDNRLRFCAHCKLNVYNLSAMTESEGEALIIAKEGKLCAKIFRRYDGTILTRDCPRGLRAARKRAAWVALRAAAVLAFVVVGIGHAIAGRVNPIAADVESYLPTSTYLRTRATVLRWINAPPPPPRISFPGQMARPIPPPTMSNR